MIVLETYNIKGHNDFELNIKRESLLTYHISYNNSKKIKGIIFILPGRGIDGSLDYQKNLIKYIAEEYALLAVFVEYHALINIVSKNKNSAKYNFSNDDIEILVHMLKKFNLTLNQDNLDFNSIIHQLELQIRDKKLNSEFSEDFKLRLTATKYPYKGEYQNFGLLQAIDILTVLYHLRKIGYKNIIKHKPIITVGNSHGGYISYLLRKFAPNTFDVIIENSSYIKPYIKYIIGFEDDINNPEVNLVYPNIILNCFTKTYWNTTKGSPYEFNETAYEIRDLSNPFQNKQLLEYSKKTSIISYHSIFDELAIYKDKLDYCNYLSYNNYNVKLNTISNENQIDGKLIKNLNHAMDMSTKELIMKEIPNILKNKKSTPTDLCKRTIIEYETSLNDIYRFNFKKNKINVKKLKK